MSPNQTKSSTETKAKPFEPIKPRMTDNEAAIEASRCLFCYDAPCTIACPSDIDVPMFIRQIMSNNIEGSAKTIMTQNIMGKSCGTVCPTEVLCEGACVYHGLNEKVIDIGRLQAYATDHVIDNDIHFFEKGESTGKKAAVIGGGPAGLACAHELTRLGHDVTVFEASEKAGGLNTYGVAPYKYSNADSQREVDYISKIGFEIKTGERITPEKLTEIEKNYDAIFLGIGLGQSRQTGIKGEALKGVYGAAEFIYNLREKEQKVSVGKRVVVIGGGNTAIDAAVESALLGADVTLVYRRSPDDQSAYWFEVDLAKQHGVKLLYMTSPVEIIGTDSATGITCVENEIKNGQLQPISGTEFELPCDTVIFATGQEKQVSFFEQIEGVTLEKNKVLVNNQYQTTNPHYFAGGDCVNGGKEVVNAVAHGRDAARGMNHFMMGTAQKGGN